MNLSASQSSPLVQRMAFALGLICLAVLTAYLWPIHQLVLQAYAVIGLFLAFRYWPPMTCLVRAMPTLHRTIFLILCLSVAVGHFTLDKVRFYPFVPWEIFPFVHERDPVTCDEYIATTTSGKKVRLLAEQLVPSIIQTSIPNADHPAERELFAQALSRIYNEHHAVDPVQSVDLIQMAVQLHPRADEWRPTPSCELLQHYEISSGR